MKHYCIFEVTISNKKIKTKFVSEFGEDYEVAKELCISMNNYRKPEWQVQFIIRCLEQKEFENLENYNPFISSFSYAKFQNI